MTVPVSNTRTAYYQDARGSRSAGPVMLNVEGYNPLALDDRERSTRVVAHAREQVDRQPVGLLVPGEPGLSCQGFGLRLLVAWRSRRPGRSGVGPTSPRLAHLVAHLNPNGHQSTEPETRKPLIYRGFPSGARGTRTPDLLGAIQALSHLSYSPDAGSCGNESRR
jgi:hypothetical protein